MKEVKIVKTGWDKQNPSTGIILMDKTLRDKVGVNLKDLVKIHKVEGEGEHKIEMTCIALVQVQFKEFVGETDVVSVNGCVTDSLCLKVGDKVFVSKQITESEYNAFMDNLLQGFMGWE